MCVPATVAPLPSKPPPCSSACSSRQRRRTPAPTRRPRSRPGPPWRPHHRGRTCPKPRRDGPVSRDLASHGHNTSSSPVVVFVVAVQSSWLRVCAGGQISVAVDGPATPSLRPNLLRLTCFLLSNLLANGNGLFPYDRTCSPTATADHEAEADERAGGRCSLTSP